MSLRQWITVIAVVVVIYLTGYGLGFQEGSNLAVDANEQTIEAIGVAAEYEALADACLANNDMLIEKLESCEEPVDYCVQSLDACVANSEELLRRLNEANTRADFWYNQYEPLALDAIRADPSICP